MDENIDFNRPVSIRISSAKKTTTCKTRITQFSPMVSSPMLLKKEKPESSEVDGPTRNLQNALLCARIYVMIVCALILGEMMLNSQ